MKIEGEWDGILTATDHSGVSVATMVYTVAPEEV